MPKIIEEFTREDYLKFINRAHISCNLFVTEVHGGVTHCEAMLAKNVLVVPNVNNYKTKFAKTNYQYPYLVKDVKDQLQNHKFWTDLPIGTCRQVVNFSHNSVYDVPLIDFMYGDLFIKKA